MSEHHPMSGCGKAKYIIRDGQEDIPWICGAKWGDESDPELCSHCCELDRLHRIERATRKAIAWVPETPGASQRLRALFETIHTIDAAQEKPCQK